MNNSEVELLSPAGNFESLKTAVYNGANAVYLGLDDFNARGNIENFTLNNLQKSVAFAHLYNVKVYITLNILIRDDEIEKALDIAASAIKCHVDAFIIQDIALASLLRKKFPKVELHASTQMGIQSLEGVQFLENIGFSRVVLARETPLSEIKRIKENSKVEIEYFIQGALCVSFSGNCYLCSLLTGNSGNRGKCKQFCRLPYLLKDGERKKEGYLLSTKDFSMLPSLKQMVSCGVKSLKIEGRARRSAYVGQVTRIYRKALDNNFNFSQNDEKGLKEVFNRGNFIEGYFKNEKIIYDKTQNNIGIEVGKVEKFKKGNRFNQIYIKTNVELNKGDVLKFFKFGKEKNSLCVNDIKKYNDNIYVVSTTMFVEKDCIVNRLVDFKKEDNLLKYVKKLQINAFFTAKIGKKAKLSLNYGDINVSVHSDEIVEEAKTSPVSLNDIEKHLSKTGDVFELKSLDADIDNIFIRLSVLNSMRREAIDKLTSSIINNFETKNKIIEKTATEEVDLKIKNIRQEKVSKNIISSSIDILLKNKDIYENIIFNPNEYNKDEIKQFASALNGKLFYLFIPVIMTQNDLMLLKDIVSSIDNIGVVANNYSALSLCSPERTIIGFGLNVYNSYTVNFYKNKGYNKIILSIEDIDYDSIKNPGVELFAFRSFYPEYMFMKHCPFKEHLNSSCDKCIYHDNVKYILNKKEFYLQRKKILTCQFILKDSLKKQKNIPVGISTIDEIL